MTGLFLRYCPPCNSTATVVAPGATCAECGGPLRIVDAHALIPALGHRLNDRDRIAAVADLPGHDRPAA